MDWDKAKKKLKESTGKLISSGMEDGKAIARRVKANIEGKDATHDRKLKTPPAARDFCKAGKGFLKSGLKKMSDSIHDVEE